MEKIKAIFLDFDWTLFDHKTRSFNEKGVEGLNKAHEKGVKLIINSARTYYALEGLNTFKLIPFDGYVVSNGGACILNGKTIYADFIKTDIKHDLLSLLESNKFGFNVITELKTYIKVTDKKRVDDFYSVYYEPYPLDFAIYQNEEVLAIQVFCYENEEEEIKTFCKTNNLRFNRFADNNVEITSCEFLKSKGINAIYDALELNKNEAMAFGDDINDIPMFEKVKYGICMGNGKGEAKKEAFYVTDNIENDGLYKALKHFEII